MSCAACAVAFPAPDDQRAHFRSDLHRYNIRRRLAGLPPVDAALFADKLAQRTHAPPPQPAPRCEPCGKTYATANAYRSHLASRRHRDKALSPPSRPPQPAPAHDEPQISPTACLFCTATAHALQDNLAHMASAHSFFVPDADYLVDPAGLIAHLAEKIARRHLCIYCNGKGRELHTLEAVRKHMIDKGHCKIAYDTEADKLDVSDYYDFTSSYPPESPTTTSDDDDDAWEDVDQDDDVPNNQLTYGDTEYELVLPSGARIGHRSMMRYYAQSFHGIRSQPQDPNSGAALVRRLLTDKNAALVPRKGGFGAFGQGTHVVKARNKGEAREAGRHIREFRDQRRKEDFKTRVAFAHNNQKHFRDPLLQ